MNINLFYDRFAAGNQVPADILSMNHAFGRISYDKNNQKAQASECNGIYSCRHIDWTVLS